MTADDEVYVVTDDAAMLSGDAKRMHPTDLQILRGRRAISTTDLMKQLADQPLQPQRDPATLDELAAADLVEVNPLQMAQLAQDKSQDVLFIAHGLMTQQRAEQIRRLRVDLGQSWRAIASETYSDCEHLPGFMKTMRKVWWPPANQIVGMALCEVAAKEFGEDYLAPPWN